MISDHKLLMTMAKVTLSMFNGSNSDSEQGKLVAQLRQEVSDMEAAMARREPGQDWDHRTAGKASFFNPVT